MAKKIHHLKGVKVNKDNMSLSLGTERLNRNLNDAQARLDSEIMTDMKPYMPHVDGSFVDRTEAKSVSLVGSGQVYAAVGPEGRFLYEGKVMVDKKTGSPYARKGAKKVLLSDYSGKTNVKNEKLQYSKKHNPKVQSHWFDAARKNHGDSWQRLVAEEMGKP